MTLGSISFASPLVLGLIPLAAAFLVYVYRKRRPPSGTGIGTLFILRQLPRSSPRSTGFLPPLQFWIDLAILLLIIVALSGPHLTKDAHRIALVIDNSPSMGAAGIRRDQTLLSKAVEGARHALTNASSSTEILVYVVAPSLRALNTEPVSTSEAITVLDSIKIGYAPDSLSRHVDRLLLTPELDGIWVYSDQDLRQEDDAVTVSGKLTLVNVRTNNPTDALPNVALFRLENQELNGTSTVRATLKNYSTLPVNVRVSLRLSESELPYLNPPEQISVTIPANNEREVSFTPKTTTWAFGRAELSIDEREDSIKYDTLSIDNVAWVSRARSQQSIQLVGPFSPTQLKIDGLLGLRFVWDSNKQGDADLDPNVPTLYHRTVPKRNLSAPSLIIYPGESVIPKVSRVGAISSAPSITRWLDSHPITTYINLQSLIIPNAHTLMPEAGAQTIIATDKGPVLVAASGTTGNTAVSGIELFPYSSVDTPALSILTLNLFKWAFASDPNAAALSPNELVPNSEVTQSYRYLDSGSGVSTGEQRKDQPVNDVGIIRSGNTLYSVQFNDESELDLRTIRRATVSGKSALARPSNQPIDSKSLLRYLALLVLALFLIDTIIRGLRRTRVYGR